MEFKKGRNNLPRVYLPEKGDIFSVDMSALDLMALNLIYTQQFKPIKIEEYKRPIKRWLPFIKKRHKYVVCEFIGDKA